MGALIILCLSERFLIMWKLRQEKSRLSIHLVMLPHIMGNQATALTLIKRNGWVTNSQI